jgi:transcriptional regulator with XRE-family HTH domain
MAIPLQKFLAELPANERAEIKKRTRELIAEQRTLGELRKAQRLTQQKLARKLGIKQESVSSLEARSDMLISTLRSYVKAMGGKLSLQVSFADGAPVELTELSSGSHSAKPRRAKKAAPLKRRKRA